MANIEDTKPNILRGGNPNSVRQSTDTIYDSTTVTYDSLLQPYGGADTLEYYAPTIMGILSQTPNNSWTTTVLPSHIQIESFGGVFGTSNQTYNEAGITFNEAGDIYGGGDSVAGAIPHIQYLGIIDSAIPVPPVPGDSVGQPYGLLLSLVQP